MISRQIARRTLLTRTGFGLGAAIGAGFGPGLEPAEAKAGPGGDVWSQGYRADKGGVKLAMYRKWPGNLGGWPDKPLPVLSWYTALRSQRNRASISACPEANIR